MNLSSSFKSEIIYQILIDRFAGVDYSKDWKQPQFLGGNIKGIIKKLPYLLDLGISCIWISPFYKTSAYHGYHITDFEQVDPHFGTKKELKDLIDATHENNMKIIADFVPNHCSYLHPFFHDAQRNPQSKFRDWFYFTKWPSSYLSFLSFPELPKLNLANAATSQYIIKVAKDWLAMGFDGYRLDHVIGPSHVFWKHFVKEVKKEFSHCILLGEAWMAGIKKKELNTIKMNHKWWHWLQGGSSDALLKSYIHILDGVLDFQTQQLLRHGLCSSNQQDIQVTKNTINHHLNKYPDSYLLAQFLDNHDMDRFLYQCHQNQTVLKHAVDLIFSVDQPVIIYYGSEKAMTQQQSIGTITQHGDILARQPMQWEYTNAAILNIYINAINKKKYQY